MGTYGSYDYENWQTNQDDVDEIDVVKQSPHSSAPGLDWDSPIRLWLNQIVDIIDSLDQGAEKLNEHLGRQEKLMAGLEQRVYEMHCHLEENNVCTLSGDAVGLTLGCGVWYKSVVWGVWGRVMSAFGVFGFRQDCDCGDKDDDSMKKGVFVDCLRQDISLCDTWPSWAAPCGPDVPTYVTQQDWAGKVLSVFEDLGHRLKVVEERLARVNLTANLLTTPKVLLNGRNGKVRLLIVC
jgi:hypothetical protein